MLGVALLAVLAVDKPPAVPVAEVMSSPLIVLATVSRYEMVGQRTVGTAEVAQTLKGKALSSVRFVHDVERRQRVRLGSRVLLFLQPLKEGDVSWLVAGVVHVHDFSRTGTTEATSMAGEGVQLPPELCTPETYCHVELKVLFEKLGLPKWESPPLHAPIFRVRQATCTHCNADEVQKKLSVKGAIDCDQSKTGKDKDTRRGDDGVMKCAREAIAAKKPFVATTPIIGCLPGGADRYIFDGKKLYHLLTISGFDCQDTIEVSTCPPEVAADARTFRCDNPADKRTACDELPSAVDVLSAPEPLNHLSCKLTKSNMGSCHRAEDSSWIDAGTPDLLCDTKDDGGIGSCRPL
ncbi:MAG: hypothetical protein QM723_35770 [Myxococcaceae bacterium]